MRHFSDRPAALLGLWATLAPDTTWKWFVVDAPRSGNTINVARVLDSFVSSQIHSPMSAGAAKNGHVRET